MDELKQEIAKTFLELAEGLESGHFGAKTRVALVGIGSEHGEENMMKAALLAARQGVRVLYIGTMAAPEGAEVETVFAETQDEAFAKMEELLKGGEADAAVAMHYPFPIGVSTVGRTIAPSTGKPFFLATTTGTSSTDRVEAMILNTIAGIAVAKACGQPEATVGLLNLDGTRQVEIALKELASRGYALRWAESSRADGGAVMRGNDVLKGTPDVMVCDSLTGNVICKMLAAASTGGSFETVGYGYGPGVGKGYGQIVMIVSRASGFPLIANAILYAAELVQGKLPEKVEAEFKAAEKAGLKDILEARKAKEKKPADAEEVAMPPKEPVTGQIFGVDVMDMEDAAKALWKAGIYAETGMGCTGPVIRVPDARVDESRKILVEAAYLAGDGDSAAASC